MTYGPLPANRHGGAARDLLHRGSCSGAPALGPPDAAMALGNRDHLPSAGGFCVLAVPGPAQREVAGDREEAGSPEGARRRRRLPSRSLTQLTRWALTWHTRWALTWHAIYDTRPSAYACSIAAANRRLLAWSAVSPK